MHNHLFRLAISLAIVFSCLACAAKRRILAPNEHLTEMGPEAAQRDVDERIRLAAEAGPGATRGKQVAGQTAGGAVVGAAAGAVAGAISGGPGLGAAAGAAAEPRQVFCVDSSHRVIWMPGSSVMLRTVSVRKGTTQTAGDREMLIAGQVGKDFAHVIQDLSIKIRRRYLTPTIRDGMIRDRGQDCSGLTLPQL